MQALASRGLPYSPTLRVGASIGDYAFDGNQLTEVILPKALYDKQYKYRESDTTTVGLQQYAFGNNSANLKFYEYDANATGKKGNLLP